MAMRWYVVHAYSGLEKSVGKALKERIQRSGMAERFGQILIPTEEVVEIRNGQKTLSERRFYPGYILIEMDMNEQTWHLVKSTPKVSGFVGGDGIKPAPIPDHEVKEILDRIQQGVDNPKPKVLFEVGEVVRIKQDPFADFQGVVEEVNYEKSRLRVSVTIFGRATPIDLEFGQVDKI
jgi:transcription termination/antitermination protein NusG